MARFHNAENYPFFLILGSPNSGKTTLMYRLYSGIFYNAIQTLKRNIEEVRVDKVRLRTLNIVENNLSKEIWEPLISECSGVIFIIDISISANLIDSYRLFQEIGLSERLNNLPLAVFANKVDLQRHEVNLIKDLKIPETQEKEAFIVQAISCKTTAGITEGMNWLMKKTSNYFYIPAFRK
ncbi:MAG: ADP-ribosylation factor-like protein [Promethearchaeota archaeon]